MERLKAGDSVKYKDDDTKIYVVYAQYPDGKVSLGLYDYPDTEQDSQTDESDLVLVARADDDQHREDLYKLYNQIDEAMENMTSDEDGDDLEKAMEYFCSMYDIREGMKHAISLTMQDQYNNHAWEQELDQWQKLLETLKGNNQSKS